jgi:hypothetical protein
MKRLLLLLLAGLAAQPANVPTPYIWVLGDNGFRIRPVVGATINADGSVQFPGGVQQTYTFGGGFVTATTGSVTQVSLDTAYVFYRNLGSAPSPGACNSGTGAIYADVNYMYVCVPAAPGTAGGTAFVWARTPMQTVW